jgi:hypothetical protein
VRLISTTIIEGLFFIVNLAVVLLLFFLAQPSSSLPAVFMQLQCLLEAIAITALFFSERATPSRISFLRAISVTCVVALCAVAVYKNIASIPEPSHLPLLLGLIGSTTIVFATRRSSQERKRLLALPGLVISAGTVFTILFAYLPLYAR